MSNDRDKILSNIRSALDQLPQRAAYPDWSDDLPISRHLETGGSLKELFARQLQAASGLYFESVSDLVNYLVTGEHTFGYCDPDLLELFAGMDQLSLQTDFDIAKIDEYRFGITRASAAIAESGTLVLKDTETSSRMAALAPWIHVAVVRETDIVPSPLQAVQRFGDDPTVIFCTGPSKTADVEGILIKGVHGPGVQIALVVD